MEQQQIVIASVLKSVSDTRMYEKFGRSISQTKKYAVNIIGFYTKNIPDEVNIKFHPLFNFKRLSLSRLLAPYLFLKTLFRLKPKIIIITTHELIVPAVCYKMIKSARIIYDVRENYYLNIKYTNAFPPILKDVLATWVRIKEYVFSYFINHFILAEKCYANQLPFIGKKYNIIENKAIDEFTFTSSKKLKTGQELRLLFTGTLSESTGVFQCINLAKDLHKINPNITLKIVGYCARNSELLALKNTIENYNFISLIGGDQIVDHKQIIGAIHSADFGLIYYPKNKSTDQCIPTKLYEYMAAELPIIYDKKKEFIEIAGSYSAGIPIDFDAYNCDQLIREMNTAEFYQNKPGGEVLWAKESLKLIDIIAV